MSKALFTVGPVLSFRGISKAGQWQVTALVGVASGSAFPTLSIEGRACPAPKVLLARAKETFLRYDLSCDQQAEERTVQFGVGQDGPQWQFSVPGRDYAPRMAYVSCNGFSDPSGMRKLVRPENAVWADLISNHDSDLRAPGYVLDKEQLWHEGRIHDKGLKRFQLLLMGGDQIYFDSIWEDVKALKKWVGLSRKEQLAFKVSAALEKEIESYYFELYAKRWLPDTRRDWGHPKLNLDGADAMARIPTVMMWDDHDIFDGWGSYSPAMQHCELFQVLMRHARKAFWVFQLQHALEDLPPLQVLQRANVSQQDPQYAPLQWSALLKGDRLALPLLDDQPGFSFGYHMGPVSLFVADLRTERSRTQVMGAYTWAAMQAWLSTLRDGKPAHPGSKCQHLIFMSSVPVAHPKLSLAEGLLDTFGQDHVLDSNADDLKDHWSHGDHEGERKRLLESLTRIAEQRMLRVSIASGDVHVAAWGSCYRRDIPPTSNWAQIQQFTSSGVVHPSLIGVAERLFLQVLNHTASKVQSIDVQHCVEMMLFPGFNRYVMPARNWLAFELDMGGEAGCKLWATWRCETEAGFSNHLQAVHPAQK
ncbi:TPA: alkaline phosphatase family protein [Pseudomonas putida]|nr:alkaline phosphatase family protein [Pseudomonas putida]